MLILSLLLVLVHSLSHGLVEPVVAGLTPLLQLKGAGPWLALGLGVWCLAGRID